MAFDKITKITIEGKSKTGDVELMNFRAVIDVDDPENMTFYHHPIDKEACKEHRAIVRADQAAFDDYAYEIQEKVIVEK